MAHLDVIEQFRRLPAEKQRQVAEQLGIVQPEDGMNFMSSIWLLRARDAGKLDALGRVVQEVSSTPETDMTEQSQAIRVHSEGREARRAGLLDCDNPYTAGSQERSEWHRGYHFERSWKE